MDELMISVVAIVATTEFCELHFDKSDGEWYCTLIKNDIEMAGATPREAVEEAIEHYREVHE